MFLVWVALILLVSISPLTTEIISPSVVQAYDYSGFDLQMGNILYFAVLALLHLCTGFVVKKIGILCGSVIGSLFYSAASLLLFFPVTTVEFQTLRMIQAVGSSFCSVSGFAAVRLFFAQDVRGSISFLNTCRAILLVLGPAASELVLAYSAAWRSIFLLLFSLGFLCLCANLCILMCIKIKSQQPFVHAPSSSASESDLAPIICLITGDAFGFAALIVWVAQAPFLAPIRHFGYIYAMTFLGSILGPCFTKRFGKRYILRASFMAMVCGLSGMQNNLWILFVAMTFFNFFRSFVSTVAQGELLGSRFSTFKIVAQLSGILHSMRMACASVILLCSIWIPVWASLGICNLISIMSLYVAFRPKTTTVEISES